jgi:hypothetical protein
MEIDKDKIHNAAFALLSMTMDKYRSVWKQLDWSITQSLHEKGYIENPANKTKSVIFTEAGEVKAEELFKRLFCKE